MRTFFPLRSNAASLVSGAPLKSVIARMKLAALLGDVVVEDGVYRLQAGPDGAVSWQDPPDSADANTWQSPAERSRANNRDGFYLGVGTADGPLHLAIRSETSLRWRATFSPLKRELQPSYEWIQFDTFDLAEPGRQAAKRIKDVDLRAGVLQDEQHFVRSRLIEHVSNDAVVGVLLGAALVVDRRHSAVMRDRLVRGMAHPVPAFESARILEPDVGILKWEDIDRLRKMRGWSQLREVWAEVGDLAITHASSPADLEQVVQQLYRDRLTEAALAAEGPRGIRKWAGSISGMILGALPNFMSLSLAVGLAAGVSANLAGEVIGWSQRRGSQPWVGAADALGRAVQAGPRAVSPLE